MAKSKIYTNDCDTPMKVKETVTVFDSDDIPVDISYSQNEVLKILDSLNISFTKGTLTAKLLDTLKKKLREDHPLHTAPRGVQKSKFENAVFGLKPSYLMWTIMIEPKHMDASTFRSQKLTMSKERSDLDV